MFLFPGLVSGLRSSLSGESRSVFIPVGGGGGEVSLSGDVRSLLTDSIKVLTEWWISFGTQFDFLLVYPA